MKAIILVAGEGNRLRPHTLNKPKCLVEVEGKSLLDRQLEVLRSQKVNDIVLVKGFLANEWHREGTRTYINPRYAETNMVWTLFCAENELNEDLLICYGDIVYPKDALAKLLQSPKDISVVIDKDWEHYWKQRCENPLDDAETLKLSKDGKIVEIGKKPKHIGEIEGQYIGLMKFTLAGLNTLKKTFSASKTSGGINGRPAEKIFMTDILQKIIDENHDVWPVFINGGWVEIDTVSDLELPITIERLKKI